MTYQATGYIRDYSSSSDTCTVELVGIGIIDTWLDGVAITAAVNRASLVHGAEVTLSIPDAHRLCEATIVALAGSQPGMSGGPVVAGSSGNGTQTGRVAIPTNGSGGGSVTVTFPTPYTVAPQLYAGCDDIHPLHVGLPTLTQFTLSFSAGTVPANSTIWATWYAYGTV